MSFHRPETAKLRGGKVLVFFLRWGWGKELLCFLEGGSPTVAATDRVDKSIYLGVGLTAFKTALRFPPNHL